VGVVIKKGLIKAEGKVSKLEKSLIPLIFIATVDADEVTIKFDIHKELLNFKEDDYVEIVVSRDMPDYVEGEDLVLWGKVLTKKKDLIEEDKKRKYVYKLLISLWGFLVVIKSENQKIIDSFDFMDRVYFKLSRKT